jgi:putative endonuclease
MKGYMYILECVDGSYYTGSTKYLERRLKQHQTGQGSNHTKKRLPVKLIYFEEFPRIDQAFYREKQIQGWSRKKKEALIEGWISELKRLAECMNDSHCRNFRPGEFGFAHSPGNISVHPSGNSSAHSTDHENGNDPQAG